LSYSYGNTNVLTSYDLLNDQVVYSYSNGKWTGGFEYSYSYGYEVNYSYNTYVSKTLVFTYYMPGIFGFGGHEHYSYSYYTSYFSNYATSLA